MNTLRFAALFAAWSPVFGGGGPCLPGNRAAMPFFSRPKSAPGGPATPRGRGGSQAEAQQSVRQEADMPGQPQLDKLLTEMLDAQGDPPAVRRRRAA